ncbi:hypothetical protein PHMEG_00038505 [Phytophthora megakarya]|uniref:Necrosis inducing protein NPP1 n=1 Tax=Phytophthora megakarya TaxID=4795 RepID=A0A225UHN3_9STRA|nr:hypothetical protein PHMEG_00038505 [Phytophthora megakarya]
MNLRVFTTTFFAALVACAPATVDHDKIEPFPQPRPVTVSEKGTNENQGCENAPMGSQVYGRAGWYKDPWAIMYAWYFPKGYWMDSPSRRHDWKSVVPVVWIDNPASEAPKIVDATMSESDIKYDKMTDLSPAHFVGFGMEDFRYSHSEVHISNTSLRFQYDMALLVLRIWFSPLSMENIMTCLCGSSSRTRLVQL